MTIDEVYRFINYVANKEQRGQVNPGNFNLLIPNSEIEFISKRLGNVKTLNDRALPQFGYKVNRKLIEDLRSLLVQSKQVVNSDGYVLYPSDYFYIDSIYKEDFTEIKVINSDEYPKIKKSQITPPTSDYPVAVPFNDRVLVDPLSSILINENEEFDEGLTDWTQKIVNALTALQALNLWIDSGVAGSITIVQNPVQPGWTSKAWTTGATPTINLEPKQVSNILTSVYSYSGPVQSGMQYRIVINRTTESTSLFLYLGFIKSGQFVPGQINNFFAVPISATDIAIQFEFIPTSGNYDFDNFGIYALNSSLTESIDITIKDIDLIFNGGASVNPWLASEYGYIYYLAQIGSNSGYLIYQLFEDELSEVSVDFSLMYQGTVYVDIYELDVNGNELNITSVTVESLNQITNVSRIIKVSSACRGVGILTRTNDNFGGEVRLYNLRIQQPVFCIFNYIKYPQKPVWAYTETDGSPVYDPINSVQLSTPKHTHVEICMIALQSIGINLDAAQITQYANMKESTIG